jgi:hypothetical protein
MLSRSMCASQLKRTFTGVAHLHGVAVHMEYTQLALSKPIRVDYAQIGLVWMELLRLGDRGKRVKLGVDVRLVLSALVPRLRLKRDQCV